MAIYNADTLRTNNPDFTSGDAAGKGTGYPIVYANEIGGSRSVQTLEDLDKIPDNVLSKSGDNTDNDAIGQTWYIIDEDQTYQLKSWEPREWEIFGGITPEQLQNIQDDIDSKVGQEVFNTAIEGINSTLDTKVPKVTGKQLSTEDFTTLLKTKLEGLSNYDDTQLSNKITQLETNFNTLLQSNPDKAINSFNEIIAFLNNIKDTDTLEGIIAGIQTQLNNKADIEDLSNIISEDIIEIDNFEVAAVRTALVPTVKKQVETNVTIEPNVLNIWDEVEELTIKLAKPTNENILNEYMLDFVSGNKPTVLTLPNSVVFTMPVVIKANTRYLISIVNNIGLIASAGL